MSDSTEKRNWIRQVVQQFEGRLLRYAAHLTGDLDRSRDVVQDTFLRLCRQPREEIEGHLAAWLFTVCRNLSLDVCRKEKRMKNMSVREAASQPSSEKTQAESAEASDTTVHIGRLMNGLTENQRDVVRLKFQNGLSYREIGSVLGLSATNVGYLIHTAIQKLRKQLNVDCS